MKGQMLFVITASLQGGFALSSPLFYSLQPTDEAELWAPKGLMHGPDVPLDFIYPTGDIFGMGNWDEVGYRSYYVLQVELLTHLFSLVHVDASVSDACCALCLLVRRFDDAEKNYGAFRLFVLSFRDTHLLLIPFVSAELFAIDICIITIFSTS